MTEHDAKAKAYMQRAIDLARLASGWASPNPLVGAVIVKNGRIIGEGYHKKCGELHAERNAFSSLTEDAAGADMYVTLEPCCHYGRTPPCTQAIIEHGIARVFIGSRDPNPLVSGKGAAMLREHGVIVTEDFMKNECDELNPVFFKFITTGKPYVALKYAMTLDGKIASSAGISKWITNEKSRAHVQTLRGFYAGILAGIGTVLADDPRLNCRIEGAHQPLRIIADSSLRISENCSIVKTAADFPTMIACTEKADMTKAERLRKSGAAVEVLPIDGSGHVSMTALMEKLGEMKISGVLVEGGGEIHDALLRAGEADHIYAYIAPMLMGGTGAKTPVGGMGFESPDAAVKLTNRKLSFFEDDILLEFDCTKKK